MEHFLGYVATTAVAGEVANVAGASGIAVGGYDPVAFFTDGKPTPGDPGVISTYKGANYLFASKAHKTQFEGNPERCETCSKDRKGRTNMVLGDDQIRALVNALSITREHEIDCSECLDMAAEFAERELASRPIPDALETVRHHLTRCGECREDYEALFTALERMQEQEESEGRPD